MLQNRYVWAGGILFILIVANIISFISSDWGLITVRVHEVPLSQVIKSIERQGGVAIYTNIDPTSPVSMDVIKVPLPEAMESLAANVSPTLPADGDNPLARQRSIPAQWKLAFFAAPSDAKVKQEIFAFQSDATATDDDTKVYNYLTPLQFISSDPGTPAADPRQQLWTGIKTPPAPAPAANGEAQQAEDTKGPPSTVQDYLNAIAKSSDIWIMAPASWDPKVSQPPSTGSSITQAVKSVVSSGRGSVIQAYVLFVRSGRQRGGGREGGFGGGDTGWASMEDRIRNAINGLPADRRAEATNQLNEELNFRKEVQAAPQEQRRDMMRKHFMNRLAGMDNWRRSPEKRAQMYQRAVANRQGARGQ